MTTIFLGELLVASQNARYVIWLWNFEVFKDPTYVSFVLPILNEHWTSSCCKVESMLHSKGFQRSTVLIQSIRRTLWPVTDMTKFWFHHITGEGVTTRKIRQNVRVLGEGIGFHLCLLKYFIELLNSYVGRLRGWKNRFLTPICSLRKEAIALFFIFLSALFGVPARI